MHGCQAPGTSTANEPEKDGFSLVVAGMAKGDNVRVAALSRILEELVARGASGVLQRAPLHAGARGHVRAARHERQSKARGEPSAELLVSSRRRPQLMIQMREARDLQQARSEERR